MLDTLDFNNTLDSWTAKVPEGSIMRDYIEATGGICDEMGFANWGNNCYGGTQWVRTISIRCSFRAGHLVPLRQRRKRLGRH